MVLNNYTTSSTNIWYQQQLHLFYIQHCMQYCSIVQEGQYFLGSMQVMVFSIYSGNAATGKPSTTLHSESIDRFSARTPKVVWCLQLQCGAPFWIHPHCSAVHNLHTEDWLPSIQIFLKSSSMLKAVLYTAKVKNLFPIQLLYRWRNQEHSTGSLWRIRWSRSLSYGQLLSSWSFGHHVTETELYALLIVAQETSIFTTRNESN